MATADEIIKNIKSGGSSSGSSGGASSAPSQPSQPTSTVDSIIWQIQNGGKSSAPSTTTSTSEVVDAITTDIKKPRRAGEDLAPTVTLKEQARKAMAGTAAGGDIAKASALANQPLVSTDNYLPTNMGEISDAYQTVFDAILGPKPKDIPLGSTDNFLPTNMERVSDVYQNYFDILSGKKEAPLTSTDNYLPTNMQAVKDLYAHPQKMEELQKQWDSIDKDIADASLRLENAFTQEEIDAINAELDELSARKQEIKRQMDEENAAYAENPFNPAQRTEEQIATTNAQQKRLDEIGDRMEQLGRWIISGEGYTPEAGTVEAQWKDLDDKIADASRRRENAFTQEEIDAINAEIDALAAQKAALGTNAPSLPNEMQSLFNEAMTLLRENPDLVSPKALSDQWFSNAMQIGLGNAGEGIASFLDMVFSLGGTLGDTPFTTLKENIHADNAALAEYAALTAQGHKGAQKATNYGAQVWAAMPAAIIAYMSAGVGTGATSASLANTAYINSLTGAEQAVAQIGQAVSQMSASPTFQFSFIQESGNAYDNALKEGMNSADAAVYSMLYGYLSAMVEVGGTSELVGGTEQFAKEVAEGKGLVEGLADYAKSIVSEMGEEVVQGMLERGLQAPFGVDTALYSNDPTQNAIIKPNEMLEEAKGAAVVSAILGGPGAVTNTVNSAREQSAIRANPETAWDTDTEYDFGINQKDINKFIDDAYTKSNTEDYRKYLHVDDRLANDVVDEIPNIKDYTHALRDNDVRHVRNSHGEQTNEKYPVTREDQKLIPYIVTNYDKVIPKTDNSGRPGLVYVKVFDNNLVYYLEAVTDAYGNEKLLVNKQMIKAGLGDIPNLVGLEKAINKKQTSAEFLADLNEIHKAYARSVYQQNSVSNENIPQPTINSNSNVASSSVVDALVGEQASSVATRIGDSTSQNTPGYELSSADDNLNRAVQMANNGVPQSIIQSETGYSVDASNDFTNNEESDVDNGLINDRLVPYSEEMSAFIEDRGDVIVSSKDVLKKEVNLAFDNPTEQHTLYFGNIPSDMLEAIIKAVPNMPHNPRGSLFKSGKDYSLIATLDSIRHLNDDSDLSRDDILRYMNRYAETIVDYDDVHYSEYKDHFGNRIDGLRFRKTYPDGIQVVYDIISNRKRSLSLKTDFSKNKQKSASTLLLNETGASTPNNGINTPEARGSQTSVGNIVSQPLIENNSNSDDNNPPPSGSNPAVDSDIDSDTVETRERGESRNIRTDEARDQQLRDFKEKNPDIYKVVKNEKTLGKALDIFETQGVEGSAATLEQALADARNGKKLPLEMVPLHKLVCDELAKSGQVERANRISSDLGAELTYAGQLGQANVILRNSSVQAKVDAFAKTVQRLIGENNANVSQEAVDDLINRYRAAETDAERDAIIDDATTAIAQSSPTTLREAFTALRYLNMLGNFKTQGRNLFGNFAMMLSAEAKDRILAISQYAWNAALKGLDKIANTTGPFNLIGYEAQQFANRGQVEQTSTVTTNPKMFGEAWQMFAEDEAAAFGEGKYSDAARGNKAVRDKKTIFKWNWGENANNWFDEGGLGRKALKFGADLPMNIMEFYRKATSWAMNEGDVIFQKVTYARALADYAKAQGYTSLAEVPAEELQVMREYAIKQAQEATFHDENAVSTRFANFDKNFGKFGKALAQGVVPFRQTPANVGVRMEEYSPIGLVNTAVEFYKAVHETGDFNAALNSASKFLTGTGLAALGFMLAKMGKARGKEDDEKLAAYENNVQGLGDYSLVLDDGTTISLDWLQPEAGAFFMGVEAAELCEDGWQADDFMALLGTTTDIALNMSFLSGVNDFIEEIADNKGNQKATPSLLLNAFLKYASQGVTNSLAGHAEQFSEQYRQTYYTDPDSPLPTVLQKQLAKLSGKTPGWDYQQADYIDAWGRKQDNGSVGMRAFESFLSPAYINENRSTPVDDELKRLNESVGNDIKGTVFPSVAQKSTKVDGERLTPEEYEIYATTGGQKALELVTDFINSEGYEDLDDKTKAETIKKLYDYAAVDAQNAVLEARGKEPVTDSGYERAKAVMKAGKLSWGEYFDIDKNRDMDGNGSPGQEETAQYLFDSGMSDEEAENVYNVYYPNAKTPYSEWAEGFRTVANSNFSREEFDALTDSITEEKKDKEPWDSAGNSAVVDAVLGAVDRGLSDEAATSLIIDYTSKNYSNPFAALIDDGHSMTEAMDFLGLIDQPGKDGTPPNRSIEQAELKAFYKEHPEEEVLIALVWDSMGYTGKDTKDFATYKASLK